MDGQYTLVEFGPHEVEVPEGGYYDRFRMNPNLDEVARDPAAGNVDYFRRFQNNWLPRESVPHGRLTSTIAPAISRCYFLAPLSRLRAMLPTPLELLRAFPGFRLVALTFFSYAVCDNDPYDEVSISVVIRRPGARGSHALELLDAMRRRNFHAHVLALPVTTEIARVRGVYGYQLPKWRTQIDVRIGADVRAHVAGPSGAPDLSR